MNARMLVAGVVFLLAGGIFQVGAQQSDSGGTVAKEAPFNESPPSTSDEPFVLAAPSGIYTPTVRIDPNLRDADGDGFTFGYIMDDGMLDQQEREQLESLGVELLTFQTFHSHSAKIPIDNLSLIGNLPFIVWVGYAPKNLKILPTAAQALQRGSREDYFIGLFTADPGAQTLQKKGGGQWTAGTWGQELERLGLHLSAYDDSLHGYTVDGAAAVIHQATEFDFVQSIDYVGGDLVPQGSGVQVPFAGTGGWIDLKSGVMAGILVIIVIVLIALGSHKC